jgi:hypothetical protein
LSRFFDVDFPFESCNDCDNGQNEVDGIVVEKLACYFSSESAEIEFVSAYTSTMEAEADEVVLEVPIEDENAADGGDHQSEIKVRVFELLSVE